MHSYKKKVEITFFHDITMIENAKKVGPESPPVCLYTKLKPKRMDQLMSNLVCGIIWRVSRGLFGINFFGQKITVLVMYTDFSKVEIARKPLQRFCLKSSNIGFKG